jgi:hypothetical protein
MSRASTIRNARRSSGHVVQAEQERAPVRGAKYRLPDGQQIQRRIGPAWTERGRPATDSLTKRTAEDWLRDVLHQARLVTLPVLQDRRDDRRSP